MLTTKRYEYVLSKDIREHPDVGNHRKLDSAKVAHYKEDILQHGLLEPLVVWEKRHGEFFLVGGFHRMAAIRSIQEEQPDYFERVDVRVVSGDIDEIRALNLKLNADRLDTKIVDYFDTVIHLNNANWNKERIAGFLDRSVSWIEDIIRYVPIMPGPVRERLAAGELSWGRAKKIVRLVRDAEAGTERDVLEAELKNGAEKKKKPLNFRSAKKRLRAHLRVQPGASYTVQAEDLLSLLLVLEGREFEEQHLSRVQRKFPNLMQDPPKIGRNNKGEAPTAE